MALFQELPVDNTQINAQEKEQEHSFNDNFSKLGFDEVLNYRKQQAEKQAEKEAIWVKNLVSPERVQEWKNKGSMTAIDVWNKKNKNELIPYASTIEAGTKSFKLKDISEKLRKGLYVTPEERQLFENFVLDMAEVQTRGMTIGGNFVNIGLETIPFMAEFGIGLLTSGGTASVGATASKLSTVALKKGLTKQIAEGAAKTAYNVVNPKTIAFTATRLPQQVRARMGDIMLSDSLAVTPEGQAILKEAEEKPFTALMKAFALTQIEVASELSGEMLVRPILSATGKLGKVIASPILKNLPEGFAESFVNLAEKTTKLPFLRAVDTLGWNGILEEMGEERIGDLLKFALQPVLEGEEYTFEGLLDAIFPNISQGVGEFGKQLASEALAFGLTGMGMNAVHGGLKKVSPKYTKDGFLLDAGIFRTAGYDSYLDSEVRKELERKGVSEDEIDNALDFSSRDDKVEFLKKAKVEFNTKEEFEEKEEEELNRQQAEVETKVFNKIKKGESREDVALANARLFGQFFRRFGVDNKEKFNKWLDKLSFRFNVGVNQGVNQGVNETEPLFQTMHKDDRYNTLKDFVSEIHQNPQEHLNEKKQIGNLKLSVPVNVIQHDKKHKLSPDEWQEIEDNINNIFIAKKTDENNSFSTNNYKIGIKTKNGNYYGLVIGINRHDNLICTALKNTKNGVEAFVDERGKKDKKKNPPMMPTSELSTPIDNNVNSVISHSTDSNYIINYIKERLNPNVNKNEDDRNLLMVHATKENNLDSILETGSLIAPSMAVINKEEKEIKFGDIVFVRNPKKIDYQNDNIHDRDIYSPRLPQADYMTSDGVFVSAYEYDSMKRLWKSRPEKFKELYGNETFEEYFKGAKKVINMGFTPSGNRRIIAYNNENLLNYIKKESLKGGENGNYGLSSLLARLAEKQTSKQKLKETAKTNLKTSNESLNKQWEDIKKEYDDIGNKLAEYYFDKYYFYEVQEEVFYAIVKNNKRILNEYFADFNKIPKELIKEIKNFIEKAKLIPRSYFEAKPMQEVSLSQFSNVVAKKGILSDKQKEKLLEWGVKPIEYEGDKLSETLEKIDKENRIFFQDNEQDNIDENKFIAGYPLNEVMDKLSAIFEQIAESEANGESQEYIGTLVAKQHILEDALESTSESSPLHNSDKLLELMQSVYYIMNDMDIPKEYIETDKKSKRTLKDYEALHKAKKAESEEKYLGYFTTDDKKSVVTIMANHNASTALHELGHVFLEGLNEFAQNSDKAKKQLEAVNKWLGSINGEYTREQHEKFARSFEAYLYKGKAPNNSLKQVFENFKEWLKAVYTDITEIKDADISDEVQELFDNMFGSDQYYQERRQANELYKRIKEVPKTVLKNRTKEDDKKIDEKNLTEEQKKYRDTAYNILFYALSKSKKDGKPLIKDIKQLRMLLGNEHKMSSKNKGVMKQGEKLEEFLAELDDVYSANDGMLPEWKDYFVDTITEDSNDSALALQALDVIVNKKYLEADFDTELSRQDIIFSRAVEDAQREYKKLISEYKNGNRNIALAVYYDWINSLHNDIKKDYEDKFAYDTGIIERNENADKFDKAKWEIIRKARELENQQSINKNEEYKQVVQDIIKNLGFLHPYDKAKLTANILDVHSTSMLICRLDNILDIAKTMEDVRIRRELEKKIHQELQTTKNKKYNGRTVGRYDYKTNKLFETLREYDRLSPQQATELLEEFRENLFDKAEEEGLSEGKKLENNFLSYKAGGRTYQDTETMKEIYDEIIKIKLIGKTAKSEVELQDKLSEGEEIDNLINIVENKKEANLFTKAYNAAWSNLESAINIIFNKDVKDEYAAEILYASTEATAWSYQKKKDLTDKIAEIYNLPKWNWDRKIIEYLSQKYTFPEIRRKYIGEELAKSRIIDRTMSKMDIINAYIMSKNEVGEKRLINQFGEDTLYDMFDELSLDDVKMAEALMETVQSSYNMVNRIYRRKYGLDLPKVSNYFPFTPERGTEVQNFNEYVAQSYSFTKMRAQSELIPMDFHNPLETAFSHIDNVSKFVFMSEKLDKANRLFLNNDLKRAIINKYGESGYKTLEQLLMNVSCRKTTEVYNGIDKVINSMSNNWLGANVAVKPITGFKQLLSASNYGVDMPSNEWRKGFFDAVINYKQTIDYMMKIPYLKARFGGGLSNEALKQTIENSAFAKTKSLKNFLALNIKLGDIGAIIFGGKPYIDYLIKEKGFTENEAIKHFILSTNRSQQSGEVSSLSNFQISMARNPLLRAITAYRNSQQQYVRMCGDALVSVANGDMTKTQCAKVIFQYAFYQPFLFALAGSGSLLTLMLTGDDDDLINDIKTSVLNLGSDSLAIFGDIYKYAIQRFLTDDKFTKQGIEIPMFSDLIREINKISKEETSLSDYLSFASFLGGKMAIGVDTSNVIGNMLVGGVSDILDGNLIQGLLRLYGMTEKRAKHITGNTK